MQRQANEYQLPLEKAKRAIREFNYEYFETMASDYLVYQHFSQIKHSFDPARISAGAILIDRLWNTNIRYSGDMEKICQSLQEKCSDIERELAKLNENDLKDHPEKIMEVAREIFPVILKGKKKRHYSFTTKFFHWCTTQHFPMIDKQARKAIISFQDEQHIKKSLIRRQESFDDCEDCLDDYMNWVYFYSDLLTGISENVEQLLRDADRDSKYRGMVVDQSLLRILDKIFWIGEPKKK